MKKITISMCLALISTALWAGNTLYVQSLKAKLLDQPAFTGKTLATLAKGQAVEVLAQSGRWYKVQQGSTQGWLSALVVAAHPPLDKSSVLKADDKRLTDKARRRASHQASAAATRGLREGDRSRASDEAQANYQALESMESTQVSNEEAALFHQPLENK